MADSITAASETSSGIGRAETIFCFLLIFSKDVNGWNFQ